LKRTPICVGAALVAVHGRWATVAPTTVRRPTAIRTSHARLGYTVVGVLPDVDGPGRHDILMAKRIERI
jgi:hypothetical protein